MRGSGRPGDPVCFAIGFGIVTIAGLFLHQFWAGAAIGLVLGGTLALIREDAKRITEDRPIRCGSLLGW